MRELSSSPPLVPPSPTHRARAGPLPAHHAGARAPRLLGVHGRLRRPVPARAAASAPRGGMKMSERASRQRWREAVARTSAGAAAAASEEGAQSLSSDGQATGLCCPHLIFFPRVPRWLRGPARRRRILTKERRSIFSAKARSRRAWLLWCCGSERRRWWRGGRRGIPPSPPRPAVLTEVLISLEVNTNFVPPSGFQ